MKREQTLFTVLQKIPDPRIERTKKHLLVDIFIIAICATICGAETWEEIAEFGTAKKEWFKTFLQLPNEIPSHDTFRRVFLLVNPKHFQESFLEWIQSIAHLSKGEIIAIDGKQVRGAGNRADGKEGLRMVSAWATENRLSLGQIRTEAKSNEIQAIPELLKLLSISGCIVTIDAMGCQKEIAKEIRRQEADYVLSLKANHELFYREVEEYFAWAERVKYKDILHSKYETLEKDHGRIERRRCTAVEDLEWFTEKDQWAGLRSLVMVESKREIIGEKVTVERRYFITSLRANAKEILKAVRSHWEVENQLHWCLDVSFREDACRTREGNAPENLAVLRHIALNLLKQEKTCKLGIKSKRLKAGWDDSYLLKVLEI
jgi:predicted transposase YbfD/YdcC